MHGCGGGTTRCRDANHVTNFTRLRCCDLATDHACANLNTNPEGKGKGKGGGLGGGELDAVCGSGVNGSGVAPITLDPVTGGDSDMDLAAAALECHAQGARLCTADEVKRWSRT